MEVDTAFTGSEVTYHGSANRKPSITGAKSSRAHQFCPCDETLDMTVLEAVAERRAGGIPVAGTNLSLWRN